MPGTKKADARRPTSEERTKLLADVELVGQYLQKHGESDAYRMIYQREKKKEKDDPVVRELLEALRKELLEEGKYAPKRAAKDVSDYISKDKSLLSKFNYVAKEVRYAEKAEKAKKRDRPIEEVILHMFYENPDRKVELGDIVGFYCGRLGCHVSKVAASARVKRLLKSSNPHFKSEKVKCRGASTRRVFTYLNDGSAKPIEFDDFEVRPEKGHRSIYVTGQKFHEGLGEEAVMEVCKKDPDNYHTAAEIYDYLKEKGVALQTKDPFRLVRRFVNELPNSPLSEKLDCKRVKTGGAPAIGVRLKGEESNRTGEYEVSKRLLNTAEKYLPHGMLIEDWEVAEALKLEPEEMTAQKLREAKAEILNYLINKGVDARLDEKGRIAAKK